MSSGNSASCASDTNLPPAVAGATDSTATQVTDNLNGTTTVARAALFANIGTPVGKVYVTFANIAATRGFIAFKLGTAAASTTVTNGYPIEAGGEKAFWMDPNQYNDVEYIMESSTGKLRWYVSSPPYEGVTGLGR